MGTGKTSATINILREHYAHERRLLRTLIFCPLIVIRNWQQEIRQHSKIRDSDVVALVGPGKKRIKIFTENAVDSKTLALTQGRIFICNYESMEMAGLLSHLKEWQPEIIVCDESHRLKSISSVRAKGVISLLGEKAVVGSNPVQYTRAAKHVYILTGTPLLNSAQDIFNQYRILDSGETFGLNFYEFRHRFFEDINKGMPSRIHFPKWMPRHDTYEKFNALIYKKATRVLKADCLDLPPLVRQRIYVELSPLQRRLYDEMKRDYITWIKQKKSEPRAVVAQMALTKMLRLQQIVSGFCKTEDGTEIPLKDNPRLDAMGDLIDEITDNHKLIIWATFHHNYKQLAELCKHRKVKYAELHGGITAVEKDKNVESFRRNSDCRVIIANQAAAGIGINLVEDRAIVSEGRSSYSVYYSKNFSLEQDQQSEARNYRGGSEVYESVTRIDLVASDTIDELILEALAAKKSMAEEVLHWSDNL